MNMTRRHTCNYLHFSSTVRSYSTSRHRPNKPLFTRMSLSELAAINTVLVSMHAASAAQREALTMQMTLRSLESPRRPCTVPAATRSTENTVAALAGSDPPPLPAPTPAPLVGAITRDMGSWFHFFTPGVTHSFGGTRSFILLSYCE